ncbi:MAG: type II toxin-antitoxin system VapC family toxin [Thaumarchaeota archaeon]|nr:type II toxin-antitoxin system VapC family toxin [Nitrososphaerota archaeon]
MHLIDTNIFLEVLLSQERSSECKSLLSAVKSGRIQAAVTDFSIYSIMISMANFKKTEELKIFLSSLSGYRGLQIYRCTASDMITATEITTRTKLDIDDAIQYSSARAMSARSIISFDRHLDGLEAPREEPSQTIKDLPEPQ